MIEEDPWYTERRERWKPETVRLLLIAESPPHVRDDQPRRYFYDEELTGKDGLFREVTKVLLNTGKLPTWHRAKLPWLRRLKEQGTFLIDLAPIPVDKGAVPDRKSTLSSYVADCVDRARALQPEGIILIKKYVHHLLAQPLRAAGLRLLHEDFIPFPVSGQQVRFREGFAAAHARLLAP